MSGSAAWPAIVPWVVVFLAACVGVVTDLRWRRLPNWLTLPVAVAGLGYAVFDLPGAATTPVGSLLGGMLAGLPFLIMMLMRGSGGGDVKMMLALGLWLGPRGGFYLAICVALAGGVLAVIYAVQRGRLMESIAVIPGTVKAIPQTVTSGGLGETTERQEPLERELESSEVREMTGEMGARRPSLEMPYALAIWCGVIAAGIWMWVR